MSANAKKYPLRFNSWTLGGHGADLFEKSAEALELERINPLRGVDEWRLGQIFDDARDGIYADLAWLYNEIEGVEPALLACCDMRESAASECGWLVNTADAARVRGFDQSLAEEQRDALLKEFGAVADDVAELAGHLTGAFFRGAAHALPLWNADGSLAGFRHLDLWNFAFDRQTGIWYWNADASRDEGTFQPIPPGELVTLASTRHADHAALPIFIRAALGAKRYGVWLDRFGIPPVAVIMPPNAEKGEQGAYMDLARKFARGGSGILPNASSVVYGTEARAVCPFIDFIRFQQQQIYLVGIGRVQSGETDGANLGGNAAGVVEDGFRRLVRRDARRIARAINDSVTRKVLARLFPGKPALAQFAWDTDAKRTAHEVLEDAGLAKSAGLAIDIGQLQELTGYKLEKAPETPQPGPFGGLNADRSPAASLQTALPPFKTAPSKTDGQGEGQEPPALLGPFLRALQGDCKLIADEVEELLKDPTPEKARALLDKIPDLVPEDPALAPLLAEEMAKAYGEAFTQGAGAQPIATNKKDANGREHGEGSDNHGQFVKEGAAGSAESGDGGDSKDGDDTSSGAPSETTVDAGKQGNPDAASASDEVASQKPIYSEEHFAKIGQSGTAESLGLPDFKDVEPDPLPPETKPEDARRRLGEGIHVTTPLGKELELNLETTNNHLQHKKTKEQYDERIAHLDAAIETFQHPHEIWLDEKTGRNLYVRLMRSKDGRKVINAVDKKAKGWSWHVKYDYFDGYRHGKLIYLRGKNEAQG